MLKTSIGKIIFVGNFKVDKRDGFGIEKEEGYSYEGEWRNDKYEG